MTSSVRHSSIRPRSASAATIAVSALALVSACSGAESKPVTTSTKTAHDQHDGGHHGEHHGEHHGQHHGGHHNHGATHFQDAEAWAKRFESPERAAWQKPDAVVSAMQLAPDAHVADIGAGTGYFATRLARAVPQGRVFAIDIEASMVRYVSARAEREQLGNLTAVQCSATEAKIPSPVDVVLIVDTYHHIEERVAYFRALRASLRGRREVVIVDFKMGDIPVGPPPSMRVAPEALEREMGEAGYTLLRRDDALLPYQHIWSFRGGE